MGGRGLRVFEDEKEGLGFFSLLFVFSHYLLFLRFHCCRIRICISHFQSAWRCGAKIKKNNNSLCKQTTTHRQHNTQDQEGASPRVYTDISFGGCIHHSPTFSGSEQVGYDRTA